MLSKNSADPQTGRVNVGRWANTFIKPLSTRTAVPRWFTPFGSGESADQKNRMLLHVLGLMSFYGGAAYLARTMGAGAGERENEKFEGKMKSLMEAQRPDPTKALAMPKQAAEKTALGVLAPWSDVGGDLAHWTYVVPTLATLLAGTAGYALADKRLDAEEVSSLDRDIRKAEREYGESNMARLLAARGVEKEGSRGEPGAFDRINAALLALMVASGYVGYKVGDWHGKKTDPVRRRRKELLRELENRFRVDQPPALLRKLDPELRNKINESAKTRSSARLPAPAVGMGTPVEPMAI